MMMKNVKGRKKRVQEEERSALMREDSVNDKGAVIDETLAYYN